VVSGASASIAPPSGMGPTPSVALLRAVRRLRVVGNVLFVGAHPDDENTRLLSWLVHHECVRTGYFSFTRGEGGQNLIGRERAPLLGFIRAQELLAARRVDGAEQFFGTQVDFGYSKSREETLTIWNRENAVREAVAVIRQFRPDIVITRFSPDERGTHGHHTSSALLALEACAAAADARCYPELVDHLGPWQVTRVVWNWFNLGDGPWPPDDDAFIAVDVGGYDPLLGESYPEMAARSLTMHKTQGFGSAGPRGIAVEYFQLLAGEPFGRSLFDGVDRSWGRVGGSDTLDALLCRAERDYALEAPHESLPTLLDALDAMKAMPAHPWQAHKMQTLCETIAGCAAIHASAHVDAGQVTPRSRSRLLVSVIRRAAVDAAVGAIRLRMAGRPPHLLGEAIDLVHNVPLAVDGQIDWPEAHGAIDAAVEVDLAIAGRVLTIARPVIHSWIDPVLGERWEPVTIVPPVTVNPQPSVLIAADARPRLLKVRVRASREPVEGLLRAETPAGISVEPPQRSFSLPAGGAEQLLTFSVAAAAGGTIRFSTDGAEAIELIRVDYPHIPPITTTRPAEVTIVRFDLARGGDHIGYIAGAGDDVAPALRQAGYRVTMLHDDAIEEGTLSEFDAIVTGIRAFNTSHHLAALMPRLLAYVEAGGTLVVQYNTNTMLNALTTAIGPYPFTIGDDRVSDENAVVTLRDPEHPVFTRPNRITSLDFGGWVQERGLCFGRNWDRHYTSLLSMHDKGEPSRDGGLLVATHGAGRLVYTGLAFFRQLPAGVPGAFRLFANLMAR
jgi:LmbE family N-acetylglucosaminyl deacetylase